MPQLFQHPSGFFSIRNAVTSYLEDISRQDAPRPVRTGLFDLDEMLGGFRADELHLVAGVYDLPSEFLLSIMLYIACEQKKHVCFFSTRYTHWGLVKRLLSFASDVSSARIERGDMLSEDELTKLHEAGSVLKEAHISVSEATTPTIAEVVQKAKRLHEQKPMDILLFDSGERLFMENSPEKRLSIPERLRLLALDLGAPVVIGLELSGDIERRPELGDLRDLDSLPDYSDTILFLYRDEMFNPHSMFEGIAEVIVPRNRRSASAIGTVRLSFNKATRRFGNMAELAMEP